MSSKERRTVPVEAIELYNQYVHGEISRRAFLSRAKQFVVAGLTAGAIVEADGEVIYIVKDMKVALSAS